jgi:hypothetical protein
VLNDYLLVFFLSVLSGISIGYSVISVAIAATCALVIKFLVEVVELYLDEHDA